MTLDELYQKTIDDQRAYLLKLQDDFNSKCTEAKKRAHEKIAQIPASDRPQREAVLKAQKAELEVALQELKTEVDHSTRDTMKKLENIIRQKEQGLLEELEKEIATL